MLNNSEIYVPHEVCEESLKEIIKELKNEQEDNPIIREWIAEWKILENDLLPLLIT